ncbi:MAG: hypothetical protein LBQ59_01070 [Candidatus Peribacteria bacterium]|jgi:hypothetical protein|nr:hypothetical protein [Candidatus Peribacteria bacterium]
MALLSISRIASVFPKYSLKFVFKGASFGNSRIHSCFSSINHNSSALQIIHSLVSHLILTLLITKSFFNFAQTRATGTFCPAFTFDAQHTIENVFPFTSTSVQLSFSLSGCFLQVFISQINTSFKFSHS